MIDGEPIEFLPPKFRDSKIANRFSRLLFESAHKPNTFFAAGFRIAGGWLQACVSVIWPNQPVLGDYLRGGPMPAIEVLSPLHTASDAERKQTLYLSEGAGAVWLVEGKRKHMSAYHSLADQMVRVVADYTYTSALRGLTVDLSPVFVTRSSYDLLPTTSAGYNIETISTAVPPHHNIRTNA